MVWAPKQLKFERTAYISYREKCDKDGRRTDNFRFDEFYWYIQSELKSLTVIELRTVSVEEAVYWKLYFLKNRKCIEGPQTCQTALTATWWKVLHTCLISCKQVPNFTLFRFTMACCLYNWNFPCIHKINGWIWNFDKKMLKIGKYKFQKILRYLSEGHS